MSEPDDADRFIQRLRVDDFSDATPSLRELCESIERAVAAGVRALEKLGESLRASEIETLERMFRHGEDA